MLEPFLGTIRGPLLLLAYVFVLDWGASEAA